MFSAHAVAARVQPYGGPVATTPLMTSDECTRLIWGAYVWLTMPPLVEEVDGPAELAGKWTALAERVERAVREAPEHPAAEHLATAAAMARAWLTLHLDGRVADPGRYAHLVEAIEHQGALVAEAQRAPR